MSVERELLKKILATGWLNNELSCEVEELLTQPEPEPVAWMWKKHTAGGWLDAVDLDKPSATAHQINIYPLYTAPPKREPLSGIEISQGFQTDDDATHPYSYWSGVDFAEKMHGIGVDDE